MNDFNTQRNCPYCDSKTNERQSACNVCGLILSTYRHGTSGEVYKGKSARELTSERRKVGTSTLNTIVPDAISTTKSNLRILHVILTVDRKYGGPLEGVLSSSDVWFRHGHERHILCLDAIADVRCQNLTVPCFCVGAGGPFYGLLRRIIPWLRYGYTPALGNWLKLNARRYDAIIINGVWNYVSFGSWRVLHKTNVPYFVFTHGMLDPWFKKAYPIKSFFKAIFWKMLEYRVLRDATGVLFTCEEEFELARKAFRPFLCRGFVVGYGTRDPGGDPRKQKSAFAARVPEATNRKILLFLSRIHLKKGTDLLVRAFARHADHFSDFDLVIAGPDQTGWAKTLQELARELGVAERIHWPGMLTGDAKWGAFRTAYAFILPSHSENFGIVVVEALACQVPVLITNKVNIWREIESDGVGIVVNDDLDSVSRGLERILSMSNDERLAMSSKCRTSFLTRYDAENNAMQLVALLKALTE